MSGEPPGHPRWAPPPSLSGLGAGALMLAAVMCARTRALHASQLLLSFNICAHIAFLLRFTGANAHPALAPHRVPKRARLVHGRGQYLHVKCLAVRRTPITPHTLRVRCNVRILGKFAPSPESPAAASSARISGRQAGSVKATFDIRSIRSAMVSGTRMLGAASVELGGPTGLLAPNGRAPKTP